MVRRFVRVMDTRVSEMELFASRVAHDIRSPLAAVGLVLEMERRHHPIEPKTDASLDRGIRSLQRVGQVVDALLVFARAGGAPPEGASANVSAVVRDTVDELQFAAKQKGIELSVEAPTSDSSAACFPGVLVSLVSNLVGNAIKYMGDSPLQRVTVRSSESRHMVRVEVEDTGPGVPSELRERIFDPYVRAAASTIPGIGLGLATVRRFAESHGGRVGLDSNDAPGGSVFWFEIPCV
jgi:signal transduction histidine kinase